MQHSHTFFPIKALDELPHCPKCRGFPTRESTRRSQTTGSRSILRCESGRDGIFGRDSWQRHRDWMMTCPYRKLIRIDGENLHRGPAHILFLVGTTIDACTFRTRPQAAASPAADQLPCRLSRNPWPSLPSENNRAPARLRSSAAAGRYVSCRSR